MGSGCTFDTIVWVPFENMVMVDWHFDDFYYNGIIHAVEETLYNINYLKLCNIHYMRLILHHSNNKSIPLLWHYLCIGIKTFAYGPWNTIYTSIYFNQ